MAVTLMISSVALLLLFLGNWLHNEYLDEKDELKKEISYSFKDVIRGIEDSLVQRVLLNEVALERTTDEFEIRRPRYRKRIVHDSIDIVIENDYENTQLANGDTASHLFVKKFSDTTIDLGESGLLTLLMTWRHDTDSLGASGGLNIVDLISRDFERTAANSDFPKNYTIGEKRMDKENSELQVAFFKDPESDTVFAARFSNSTGFILKSIWQQILFALILFSAVSASFFIIYSNWRKQQKLIDIKNDFISNVTHELKTPISTVSVALEALSDFQVLKNKARTEEYLDISRNELNRLRMLVDKVLKMSIFEKGASKLHIESLELDQLVEEVASNMKIQFEKENVHLNIEKHGEDFLIHADKVHFTNVIYNLLDNAVKYSRKDPVIDLSITSRNDTVILSVGDNGIGIPPGDRSKIFERFYRVPTGATHDVKGHGLGLTYVESVVSQHGGKIEVESEEGKGSTFTVILKRTNVKS